MVLGSVGAIISFDDAQCLCELAKTQTTIASARPFFD